MKQKLRRLIGEFLCLGLYLSATLSSGQTTPLSAAQQGATPYFTAKMENLTQKLQLTSDQQQKLKPIAEQEVGSLEEIRGNPVLTKNEKLSRLESVVRRSDKQMKPFLSAEQWGKLQNLRKEQQEELKTVVQEQGKNK